MPALPLVLLVLGAANLALLVLVLRRLSIDTIGQTLRGEFRASRDDGASSSRELRQELSLGIKGTTDSLVKTVGELGQGQSVQLRELRAELTATLGGMTTAVETQLKEIRDG